MLIIISNMWKEFLYLWNYSLSGNYKRDHSIRSSRAFIGKCEITHFNQTSKAIGFKLTTASENHNLSIINLGFYLHSSCSYLILNVSVQEH